MYLADDVQVANANSLFFFQNRTIFVFDPADEDKRKVSKNRLPTYTPHLVGSIKKLKQSHNLVDIVNLVAKKFCSWFLQCKRHGNNPFPFPLREKSNFPSKSFCLK